MQLVVKHTSIAYGLSVVVASPKSGVGGAAVGADLPGTSISRLFLSQGVDIPNAFKLICCFPHTNSLVLKFFKDGVEEQIKNILTDFKKSYRDTCAELLTRVARP